MSRFSDLDEDRNPYAPPAADLDAAQREEDDDELQLMAERGSRWWARVVDNLLLLFTGAPVYLLLSDAPPSGPGLGWFTLAFPGTLIAYQWYRLSVAGQTIGKRWLGVKVVRLDGSPVGFLHGVFLREWAVWLISAIPYVGSIAGVADALMIFGEERRCLHDHIAGTKVILALRSS